jgi:hypothetical protein
MTNSRQRETCVLTNESLFLDRNKMGESVDSRSLFVTSLAMKISIGEKHDRLCSLIALKENFADHLFGWKKSDEVRAFLLNIPKTIRSVEKNI